MVASNLYNKNKMITSISEKKKSTKLKKQPSSVIHGQAKSRPVLLVFLSLLYIVGGGIIVIDLGMSSGSGGNFVVALLVLLAGFGLLAARPMARILIMTVSVCLLGGITALFLMVTDSHVSFQWAGQFYTVNDFISINHLGALLFIIFCLFAQCYILMLDNVKAYFGMMPWD